MKPRRIDVGEYESEYAAIRSIAAKLGIATPRLRTGASGMTVSCHGRRAHTEDMGRIIGTILGAILAIWLAVTAAGGIFATLKTFLIIGLIAMAVFIVVWLVARGSRRG
jgi:hypothetical protein